MEKGRYFVHFQGGLYKMLGIAQDSKTQHELVIYQAQYGDYEIWVRPKNQFFEKVICDGVEMDHFKEITEEEASSLLPQKKENV